MVSMIEKTGKTVQQAINDALEELGASAEDVIIEVLDEGEAGGLLGLGRRAARVRVSLEAEEPELTADDQDQSAEPVYYGDDEYAGDPETPEEAETTAYVASILSGIGIHGKISSYREENTLHIEVTGADVGAAIGHHGETLDAIQYLASLVANKHANDHVRVSLDIGGYRQRRESMLINMAERAAEKVSRTGRSFRMEPMNPAERRIIHASLQSFPGVTTHSEGEEPDRRVIISPVVQ
jgi:spoIIIJ-associated protein